MKVKGIVAILGAIAISGIIVGVVLTQRKAKEEPSAGDVVEEAAEDFENRFGAERVAERQARDALDEVDESGIE